MKATQTKKSYKSIFLTGRSRIKLDRLILALSLTIGSITMPAVKAEGVFFKGGIEREAIELPIPKIITTPSQNGDINISSQGLEIGLYNRSLIVLDPSSIEARLKFDSNNQLTSISYIDENTGFRVKDFFNGSITRPIHPELFEVPGQEFAISVKRSENTDHLIVVSLQNGLGNYGRKSVEVKFRR